MKALIKENKNKGFSLKDIEKPKPEPDKLLIKVKRMSICGGDNYLYNWSIIMHNWNIPIPLIVGHEICGDIIFVGENLKKSSFNFKIGDRIALDSHIYCNSCSQCVNNRPHNCENLKILGIHANGGFTEFLNVSPQITFKIPEWITYEEGALLEPFGVSTKAFSLANPLLYEKVAIIGGGPIGLFIAKLSVSSGIRETYLFEPIQYRRDLAKRLGIKKCFNPLNLNAINSIKEKFDTVFEVSGTSRGLQFALEIADKNAQVIIVGAQQEEVQIDVKNNIMIKELRLLGTFGRLMWQTWHQMIELLSNKQIDLKEFITHSFSIDKYEQAFSISLSGNCGKIIMFFS